jgi:hypothetical protein
MLDASKRILLLASSIQHLASSYVIGDTVIYVRTIHTLSQI